MHETQLLITCEEMGVRWTLCVRLDGTAGGWKAPAAVAVPRPLPRNPGMGTCATRQYIILIILLPLQFLLIIRTLLLSFSPLAQQPPPHANTFLSSFSGTNAASVPEQQEKAKHNALGIRRRTCSSRYFLLAARSTSISLFGRGVSLSGDQEGGAKQLPELISIFSGRLTLHTNYLYKLYIFTSL